MLKNVAKDNGVIPVILLFIYMMIAVIHIPIIYFIGKEGVLIFFDEATRRSYSKNRVVNIAPIESVQPVVLQESDQCLCDQPAPIESNSEPEEEKSNNQNVIENNEEMRKTDKIESMDSSVSIVKTPSTPKAPNPKEYLTMKPLYYYTLTILSFVTVVILSIIVGDVSLFFGIIGSLVACFMILAGPGSYYIYSKY